MNPGQTPAPGASARFGAPAIALHWLIAILIFGGFNLGLFMAGLPVSAEKLRYYSFHKWIGVTVFLLALLRAGWRMTHPAPTLPAGPRWEHLTAHLTHFALYALMLAIPLSGWLHSSAAGYQTVYLGLIPLPDLLAKDVALSKTLGAVHGWLNWALLALLLAHVGAALMHHWQRRDGVLLRMLPRVASGFWAVGASLFAVLVFGAVAAQLGPELLAARSETAATSAAASGDPAQAKGTITAEFRQMNVPVTGSFTAFRIESLQFDPAAPEAATAEVVVDTASFDIGDADYNAEVRKKEWFDASAFPQARFKAAKVARLADDHYQAEGTLTIKGRTAPIVVNWVPVTEAGGTRYRGEARLSRAAYAIGDAGWNDVLDDAVIVRFDVLVPAAS